MTELIEGIKEITLKQWLGLAVSVPFMFALVWLMALIGG